MSYFYSFHCVGTWGSPPALAPKLAECAYLKPQMIEPGLMEQGFRLGTIFLWWADMSSVPAQFFLWSLQPLACASVLTVLL